MDPRERLIVALDVSSAAAAQKNVAAVGDSAITFKVGKQLFTAEGPQVVRALIASGRRVFLDLKYHDIPNTVAAAVSEAARLRVSMLSVHASGAEKMLRAAVETAKAARTSPLVLAVTVLTSFEDSDLEQVGIRGNIVEEALRLGSLALASGCGGLISSAREAPALRAKLGDNFVLVTPGVRPAGSSHGDQARVVTPAEAIAAGASHIVVGRPITAAPDPAAAARAIIGEISSQLSALSV